jgi:predicted dehydrogenase
MRKFWRFVGIYGVGRTLFKASGRLRIAMPLYSLRRVPRDIGIIGCGQFAFSTISYFLWRSYGHRIAACFDIDKAAAASFARAMRVPNAAATALEVLGQPGVRLVYVASNHASHSGYAIQALERGLDVYIEKPVAVSYSQLVELLRALKGSRARVFAGYNRPFSGAIRLLRQEMDMDPASGISMQCFVAGHLLAVDHWYRRPEEGTRVCGNMGHWLDLMVHVLCWRGLPDHMTISILAADQHEPDENIVVSLRSDRGDVVSIMLTARSEPFEGILETINIQHGGTTCAIDDFRRVTIWKGARLRRRRYRPKDVGHRAAVLQPFSAGPQRAWHEVVLSTLLMLEVTEMVRSGAQRREFAFAAALARLEADVNRA